MKQTKQKFWEKLGLHNFFLLNWYKPKLQRSLYFFVPFAFLFQFVAFLRKKLYKLFAYDHEKSDKKADKKTNQK